MDTQQGPVKSSENGILALLRSASQDRSGMKGALAVLIVSAVVSLVCWFPLSLPSRLIKALLPTVSCTNMRPGSMEMYLCSAGVAGVTMVGPVLLMVLIFFFRKQLTRWLGRVTPRLPEETRFLTAPVLATIIFTVGWSGAHQTTAFSWGLLPHLVFPAVIGLFTYAVSRYGAAVQTSLAAYFTAREKFPRWLLYLIVFAVPILIAVAITAQERVSFEALKEQFIVIVALIVGYLVMSPRIASPAKEAVPALGGTGQQP